MSDGELDKSQEPTQFKLQQARNKGLVARGMDLGFLVSLAVLLLYMRFTGQALLEGVGANMRRAWISGALIEDGAGALAILPGLTGAIAPWLTLFFGILFLTVLVFELVQTGAVFSTKPLKPDFSKLNPAQGLKRLFSMRMLIETGKNLLKFTAYVAAAFFVIRGALRNDIAAITDGRSLANVMAVLSGRLLLSFIFVAMIFAAIDQLLSRRMFSKNMRMSRREVKREVRDREGDPRLKQKRKQLHASFLKTSQSLRNLPGADVLVTNPQHLAVALRYDNKSMPAPLIVSMGANDVAQRLKRLAVSYGIPIVENRALARALYRSAALDQFVPEGCFAPVAGIYNDLRRSGVLKGAGR